MTDELTHEDLMKNFTDKIKNIVELSKLDEPTENENYVEPLSIEKEVQVKVLLSYGGPADGFNLYFKNEELIWGEYFYQNWGTNQTVKLNDDELETVFQFYLYGEFPDENN